MIEIIADMLRMYWAMLWYYILKLPYAVRIFISIAIAYIAIRALATVLYWAIKIFFPPLLLKCLKLFICILQRLAFSIVKWFPHTEEIGSNADEVLNAWGIQLEVWHEQLRTGDGEYRKKVPVGKVFIAIAVGISVFVIVPFYLEPMVEGNARSICMKINSKSQEIQDSVFQYVNRYYTPVTRYTNDKQEQETEAERVILHLGEVGKAGANIRSTPGIKEGNIIKAVFGDVELFYENEIFEENGTVWVKVSMEDLEEGWISRKMLDEVD